MISNRSNIFISGENLNPYRSIFNDLTGKKFPEFGYFVAMQTYRAGFTDVSGRQYPAEIFLSSVTITIRIRDDQGNVKDIYWLAARVKRDESVTYETRLHYPIQNGTEQLKVTDAGLEKALKQQFRSYKFSGASSFHQFFASGKTRFFLITGIVLAVLFSAYIWLLPWIGERIAMRFSKETEIELGESMYQSVVAEYEVDNGKTNEINRFYQQLDFQTGYPVQITVVKSKVMNAFAIPGGHIVVYDAILKNMNRPEELAALLGHEASHIAHRHSLRSLFRGMARQMFVTLIFGNDSGLISSLANNADALKGLQYSRSLETEADNEGMALMAGRQVDPSGMADLMELLQQETSTQSGEPVSFLSTHPVFKDRIENIRKQIANYKGNFSTSPELKKSFEKLQANW